MKGGEFLTQQILVAVDSVVTDGADMFVLHVGNQGWLETQ
jgi:hypothetical protein